MDASRKEEHKDRAAKSDQVSCTQLYVCSHHQDLLQLGNVAQDKEAQTQEVGP